MIGEDEEFLTWLRSEAVEHRRRTASPRELQVDYLEEVLGSLVGEEPLTQAEIQERLKAQQRPVMGLAKAIERLVKKGIFRSHPASYKEGCQVHPKRFSNVGPFIQNDPGQFHGRLDQVWAAVVRAGVEGVTAGVLATKLRVRDLDVLDEMRRLEHLGLIVRVPDGPQLRAICKDPNATLPQTIPDLESFRGAVVEKAKAAGDVGLYLDDILQVFGGFYKLELLRKYLRREYLRKGLLVVHGRRGDGRYYSPGVVPKSPEKQREGLMAEVLDLLLEHPGGLSLRDIQSHVGEVGDTTRALQQLGFVGRLGSPQKSIYRLTRRGVAAKLG